MNKSIIDFLDAHLCEQDSITCREVLEICGVQMDTIVVKLKKMDDSRKR